MSNETRSDWKILELSYLETLAGDVISDLVENKIAALKVKDFYSSNELSNIVQNTMSHGINWYPNFEFKQGRIGLCATEYHSKINGKQAYFILQPENIAVKNRIFGAKLEPTHRLISYLSKKFKTSVAVESDLGEEYFTGLIRAMQHKSTTHFDFAPHQLPGWKVSEIDSQLSAVLYLQVPDSEGALTVFNRPWDISDEAYNKDELEKGPKGFEDSFLINEESISIQPIAGELVIFNSRNFHQVGEVSSSKMRLSVNTFIGVKNEELLLWD